MEERNLLVGEFDELNWSGRGQHAEYQLNEAFDLPLLPVKILGHMAHAVVESVLCRRILLARKTISCRRKISREDAIKEVEHLQRLKHTHIIQVIGTYTLAKDLSILLYPVAEWNLKDFLKEMLDMKDKTMERSLRAFFGCLSSSLNFIHGARTKHLDIKPMNILVKDMGPAGLRRRPNFPVLLRYKVIIADFGISRYYGMDEVLDTDTPVSFTMTYAAPEVVYQETRGLSADVFSLGCVFTEMIAALANMTITSQKANEIQLRSIEEDSCSKQDNANIKEIDDLSYLSNPPPDFWSNLWSIRSRNKYGDASYYKNVSVVQQFVIKACLAIEYYRDLLTKGELYDLGSFVATMLDFLPVNRPTATQLEDFFKKTSFLFPCPCIRTPDPFVVAESALIIAAGKK